MPYKQHLDYGNIVAPLTIPGNLLIQELDKELHNNQKYFGAKVFRSLLNGKSLRKIKQEEGHSKKSDTVENFSRVIQALRSTTTVHRLNKQAKEQMIYLAKGIIKDCNDEQLIKYLNAKIEEANGISSSTANNMMKNYKTKTLHSSGEVYLESARILNTEVDLGAKSNPGVYVYSYPQYLAMEAISPEGRGLYKIGASGSVAQRVERQRRQTEVPEDLVLVRTFYSDEPFELEAKFHNILKAANMHQKSTQGGTEWFSAPLAMIDEIAKALKNE